MNLQVIKSLDGKAEYVLLPIHVYNSLRPQINAQLQTIAHSDAGYEAFDPADYVDNPIALARIKAGVTQEELAERMNVSQAYVSKAENQKTVTPKLLKKAKDALKIT